MSGLRGIHTNHLEAQNASTRRRNSTFRRRINTYAKSRKGLQRTLDVQQIIHNFVRPHWTTGLVPAVALGIISNPLNLIDILNMKNDLKWSEQGRMYSVLFIVEPYTPSSRKG